MSKIFKHGIKISNAARFKNREILLRPFLKKYKMPVLVHAVNNINAFKRILHDDELKLPRKHKNPVKFRHMEQFLKSDNKIFFSIGFVYATAYKFKYNLIFELGMLKNLEYYRRLLIYGSYKCAVDYWYEKDRAYLEKLSGKSNVARSVVQKYCREAGINRKNATFEFWRIEDLVFQHIQNYHNSKYLFKLIRENSKKCIVKYPSSIRLAVKDAPHGKNSEILAKKSIRLSNNPWFIGFYILGNTPPGLMKVLRKKYPSKIFFDGKKIIIF